MKNVTNFYRVIKSIQGVIVLVLGLLFAIFFQNDTMYSALSYSLASVVMIYGILSILFSYLFQRGVASTDTISGVILIAISFFVFFNPNTVINFLPMIFGTILITYSMVLFIEVTINSFDLVKHSKIKNDGYSKIKSNLVKNIILYSIVGALFLSLGIVILFFGEFARTQSSKKPDQIIVLIIGIILILIGLFLSIYPLISPKKDIIIADSKLIKDVDNTPVKVQKSATNSQKPRKSQSKNKNSEAVKELPNYEIDTTKEK